MSDLSVNQLVIKKLQGDQIYHVFYGELHFEITRIPCTPKYPNGFWSVDRHYDKFVNKNVEDFIDLEQAFSYIETEYRPKVTGGTRGDRRKSD